MVLEAWFDQPAWLMIAILAAVMALTGLAIHGLSFWPRTRPAAQRCRGVVAPFFGAVSVLFALLTGFVANDAWERQRSASRSLLAERDSAVAIYELSIASVSDMETIRTALKRYLDAVITDEWPSMRDGRSSPAAGRALLVLLRELSSPIIAREAGQVVHAALLDLSLRARSARSDRLALAEQYSDHAKWWTVILLAMLTQVAVGAVHLDSRSGQAVALTIVSIAVVIALGLVAIKERPFDGPSGLPPTALQEALAAMKASTPVPDVPVVPQ